MAGGLQGARLLETFTSEWDLSAKQYRAVHIGSADDKVIVCSAGLSAPIGLVQNKPTSGEAARVVIFGYAKGIAGDTITRNGAVAANSFGYLVSNPGSGVVVGTAMQSVASGSVFSVLVNPHFRI